LNYFIKIDNNNKNNINALKNCNRCSHSNAKINKIQNEKLNEKKHQKQPFLLTRRFPRKKKNVENFLLGSDNIKLLKN
jgi:hypothetical protein